MKDFATKERKESLNNNVEDDSKEFKNIALVPITIVLMVVLMILIMVL